MLPLFSLKPQRYQAVYYLLIGKRTVSNLLAGLSYDLLPYFHFYPKLSQADYQVALQQLVDQHYLRWQAADKTARLTPLGKLAQTNLQQREIWPTGYDYWQDGDWQLQWERLLLSVQVISNYQHQQNNYAPLATQPSIQTEIHDWFYRQGRRQADQFVQELVATTATLPPNSGQLLANSLRSDSYAGISDFELGLTLNLTAPELTLVRVKALSELLQAIRHLPSTSSLRGVFQFPNQVLSKGAANTYRLWLMGQPWSQIVQRSYQKEGTLLEHLLEAAILVPDFDFTNPNLQTLVTQDPESYFSQRLIEIQQQRQVKLDD